MARLREHNFPHPYEHLSYSGAGHARSAHRTGRKP